jgi:hypothetical protein
VFRLHAQSFALNGGRRQHNRDERGFSIPFRLDEVVPDDHLVREIAAVLDPFLGAH